MITGQNDFLNAKAREGTQRRKRVVFEFDEPSMTAAALLDPPYCPNGFTEIRSVRDGVERILMIPIV